MNQLQELPYNRTMDLARLCEKNRDDILELQKTKNDDEIKEILIKEKELRDENDKLSHISYDYTDITKPTRF
jgi:hypothetical protein